ncbi:MAG: PAS domain S-box protein [Polyangiaceae bacterium]|nr:PAS domain S-box protein [Polyangiaceae bacterium]
MSEPLQVLIVEDSENDALLLLRELEKAGYQPQHTRVQTKEQLLAALGSQPWDILLSDYMLPSFDAPKALEAVRSTGIDLPCIVISGTVGEEVAVQTMKAGAHDYLLKGSLTRLGEAIRRELRDAEIRREHRANVKKLEHLSRVLRGIRDVNELIVREKDPDVLLRQSCNKLVESRGYQAAWIAVTEPSETLGRIVAEQGMGDAFDEMRQRLMQGLVPACCEAALRAHEPQVIREPHLSCPAECPLARPSSSGCDGPAAMAMTSPLEHGGRVFGFVCVQVPEGLETDEEEAGLLAEVAGDIAFALWTHEVELERRQVEELFRLSFENASVGKSLTLPDGNLGRVNRAFCTLLGYSREELEAKSFEDVTHPQDLAATRECVRCLLAGEQPSYRMEKRYLRKDGQEVWTDVSTTLLRNEDQTPKCFITQVLDISERKHFENALQQSEQKFRVLFEHAADGILLLEIVPGGIPIIRDANHAMLKTLGYERSELIGRPVTLFEVEPDANGLTARRRQGLLANPGATFEVKHRCKDGSVRTFECLVTEIEVGTKTFGVSVERDITDRKRYEAQIAQSDRLASMGMLAAGVAHEINNPLSYVVYNLESLNDELPRLRSALDHCLGQLTERLGHDEWLRLAGPDQALFEPSLLEDVQSQLRDALQGTYRIKDIARGLGTFSRVEQDRLVPVDLAQVIEVAINMVHNEIKYRARLVREYGKVDAITANDGRLSQVFLNLLVNAAHAIPEGDSAGNEIRVRTWQEGNEVCAEVRDTGSGIAPEHLQRVFEPLFTTKQVGVGTGLGLPISKNIVEGYGGRIEVTSALGTGTCFVVRLPAGTKEEHDRPTQPPSVPVQIGGRGRILVVDDEPRIRAMMTRMLKGHEVVEAASGEQARTTLENDSSFDLILCDMMMPVVSGVDLHKWLRATHPKLADRLVFLTGGAFTPATRDYLGKVSNIRLEKPFAVADFKKVVSEMVLAGGARAWDGGVRRP